MIICKNRNPDCPVTCVHFTLHLHRHHNGEPKDCADCKEIPMTEEKFHQKQNAIRENLMILSFALTRVIASEEGAENWAWTKNRARVLTRARDRLKRITDRYYKGTP